MTKHFAEEEGSCILSEKVYTLKDWVKFEEEPKMCSCGSRQKSKCVKEGGHSSGKMCLREDEE